MARTHSLIGSALFLVLAPGTVGLLVPHLIKLATPRAALPGWPLLAVLGAVLALFGLAVLLESFLRFAVQGRGTPAPIAAPERLVVSGFYRYVRNPMYVAVLALVAGQGLITARPWTLAYGLGLWAAFHAFVTGYEEPTLRRSFPDEYGRYVANVPRWAPRLRPWKG
ncbi:MAG: isoprenylcysteine carboxylmethyltransferase family protein [Phenylobacterium sp.]|nr:isoprenylcysteine carboxylmethyltransferase family protein [Phenylobacterium sp.]